MHPNMGMAAAAYRQAAANVHPTIVVVKLYDEIILAINQAIRAKQEGNPEQAFNKVLRAASILRGLAHSLDFDKGGAVAEQLLRVYKAYIVQIHLHFGKTDVVRRYQTLLEGLVELRDAWAFVAGVKPREPSAAATASVAAAQANAHSVNSGLLALQSSVSENSTKSRLSETRGDQIRRQPGSPAAAPDSANSGSTKPQSPKIAPARVGSTALERPKSPKPR